MLHHRQRAAILELSAKGLSARQIAKALKISRPSVKKVVGSGTETVPRASRPSRLEGQQEEIQRPGQPVQGDPESQNRDGAGQRARGHGEQTDAEEGRQDFRYGFHGTSFPSRS